MNILWKRGWGTSWTLSTVVTGNLSQRPSIIHAYCTAYQACPMKSLNLRIPLSSDLKKRAIALVNVMHVWNVRPQKKLASGLAPFDVQRDFRWWMMKNGCKWANTAGHWRKGWISVERAFWSHTSETSRAPERGQTLAMAKRKCACPSGDGWRGASWRHRGLIYSPSQGVLAALWNSLLEEPQEAMKCGPADVSGLVRSLPQDLKHWLFAFPCRCHRDTELNRAKQIMRQMFP